MATSAAKVASFSPELTQALVRAAKALDHYCSEMIDGLEKSTAVGHVREVLIETIEEHHQSVDLIRGALKRHGTVRYSDGEKTVIRPYVA